MAGSCEYGNDPSRFHKMQGMYGFLKDSASYSQYSIKQKIFSRSRQANSSHLWLGFTSMKYTQPSLALLKKNVEGLQVCQCRFLSVT